MKSAPFTLSTPVNLEEAIASLKEGKMYSKLFAGSQSLGPMLNLRLSQPDHLISLRHLPDLRENVNNI
jgi:carbon-monoxide dehydrogenase medium subunit